MGFGEGMIMTDDRCKEKCTENKTWRKKREKGQIVKSSKCQAEFGNLNQQWAFQ